MPAKTDGAAAKDRCGKLCDEATFAYLPCGRPVDHKGRHKARARLAHGTRRRPLDVTIRWGTETYGMHCSGCEGHCDGEGVT